MRNNWIYCVALDLEDIFVRWKIVVLNYL